MILWQIIKQIAGLVSGFTKMVAIAQFFTSLKPLSLCSIITSSNGNSSSQFTRHSNSILNLSAPSSSSSAMSLPKSVSSSHSSAIPYSAQAPDDHDISDQALIIEPIKDTGVNVLIIFFPGALTPSEAYRPLLQLVQKQSDFRLWAVINDPVLESYCSDKFQEIIEASIDGMIRRAQQHGFVPGQLSMSNVFIAGHSIGSYHARSVAKKKSSGFIQMGCWFPTGKDDLVQYPKPVLTLGGSRDGQLKLAGMARNLYNVHIVQPQMGSFYTVAVKPVIIIPGMNHAQFSHGIPNKDRGDMQPEISLEQARYQTANYISSFISLHLEGQHFPETAMQTLKSGVEQTHKLYGSFAESLSSQDSQVKQWQLTVAGLDELTEENVVVIRHDYLDNFIYSKPWIDLSLRRIFVQVFFNSADKFEIVKNVWVKMKSREAVFQAFQGDYSSNSVDDDVVSAKQLNLKTFQKAVSLLPEEVVMKFHEGGKKLRFADDFVVRSSGEDWINSDVTMKAAEDGSPFVDVCSPVVITPVSGIAARFAGMHYMKLLSISRCMEWVMLEGFRK